jgi:hypothetical protein
VPSKRENGTYQAKVRNPKPVYLGNYRTWEEARLAEVEFKVHLLEHEELLLRRKLAG